MVAGFPPADDESAIELLSPLTYFAKLPVIAHSPWPVGSQTTPTRGLKALSSATVLPALSLPWFLSHRRPRLTVTRSVQRQLSLTKSALVLKLVPSLPIVIGLY